MAVALTVVVRPIRIWDGDCVRGVLTAFVVNIGREVLANVIASSYDVRPNLRIVSAYVSAF